MSTPQSRSATVSSPLLLAGSWLLVGTPLAWGVWQTLLKAAKLVTG